MLWLAPTHVSRQIWQTAKPFVILIAAEMLMANKDKDLEDETLCNSGGLRREKAIRGSFGFFF